MLGHDAIAALIPHQGSMCLLDTVLEWDAERALLLTRSHRAPDNPLRAGGRLRALHLCEYGAQAMAVHGGLAAQALGARAAPGLLVSLRDVRLHCQFLEDLPGELRIETWRLGVSPSAWQYAFNVHHDARLIGAGRAAIIAEPARA